MDGIELTARLRRTARTCEVPVVLLTTSIFPAEQESARRAGCNSVMLLPVSPDELLDQVRSFITHA
jgi:CheY-like chemotaxis protein